MVYLCPTTVTVFSIKFLPRALAASSIFDFKPLKNLEMTCGHCTNTIPITRRNSIIRNNTSLRMWGETVRAVAAASKPSFLTENKLTLTLAFEVYRIPRTKIFSP